MNKLFAMLAVAAVTAAFAGAAGAQEKLVVAGYGGSFEDTMRKEVFPPFEKAHNVKIDFVAGNSTNTIARLEAQKSNQEIDVAIVDDGPMYQAIALGFCAPIQSMPVDDIYATARYKDDKAVGIGIVATGLMYNKKAFADKGWAAPTSWSDLADPKFKKLVVIPPLNNTYEPSPGKMTELFQSGQAVIGVWGTARAKALSDTGFPIGFVYPKEGAYALLASVCPVAKTKTSPLAQEFVRYLLTPEVQMKLAVDGGFGPVNKKTAIKDDANVPMPIGKRAADLIVVDWDTINANREAWNKRWTREIER